MQKIAVTYDQGRVHIELDLDISKESLNHLLEIIAQNVPTALQGLQTLTTEKSPEVPSKQNTNTSEKIPVG